MKKIKRGECLGISILLGFSLCFLSSFLYGTAFAAAVDFPKKEITVIVGFAPGGGRDIIARGVGKTMMSKYLGVPIVVYNIPGAGGARGNVQLFHSAPDGYTLGIGAEADIFDQIVEKRDYDNKKFTFIGIAQRTPPILLVKSDSSFRSVKDFKTFGKPIRYSSSSPTSPATIASMVLANREGFQFSIIGGYQVDVAAMLGLIRGEVEFTTALTSSAISFIKAGQIRPILVIGQKRHPSFPDIPTIVEVGHPDLGNFALDYWFMAPPGVPKDRAQILEDALVKTLKDPEFLEWARASSVDTFSLSGEDTARLVSKLFEIFEQYRGDIEKHIKKVK